MLQPGPPTPAEWASAGLCPGDPLRCGEVGRARTCAGTLSPGLSSSKLPLLESGTAGWEGPEDGTRPPILQRAWQPRNKTEPRISEHQPQSPPGFRKRDTASSPAQLCSPALRVSFLGTKQSQTEDGWAHQLSSGALGAAPRSHREPGSHPPLLVQVPAAMGRGEQLREAALSRRSSESSACFWQEHSTPVYKAPPMGALLRATHPPGAGGLLWLHFSDEETEARQLLQVTAGVRRPGAGLSCRVGRGVGFPVVLHLCVVSLAGWCQAGKSPQRFHTHPHLTF